MTHTGFHLRSMLLVALALAAPSLAQDAPPAAPPPVVDPVHEVSELPPVPATPASVLGVLHAQPFTLQEGYAFEWRADQPLVTSGWLLVLHVDPLYVVPRQLAQPVMYVGSTTAERVNHGYPSGRVVAIVPSPLNEQGEIELDLAKAMMWFGTPALPEQVDGPMIEAERQAAIAAGFAPFNAQAIADARAKGGRMLEAANREALRKAAADLISTYSPQESELVEIIQAEADAAAK